MSQAVPLILIDGAPAQNLSVLDRGFQFGDGLFESFFCRPNHIPLLSKHLERLRHGCEVLGLPYPEALIKVSLSQLDAFLDTLDSKIRAASAFKAKLIITRGTSGVGYRPLPLKEEAVTVVLTLNSFDRDFARERQGVTLQTSNSPLSSNRLLAGVKHLNRLDYVLAARTVQDPTHVPALLDEQGRIIEALHHNLFYVRNDRLYTPVLARCGVEGIAKAWLKANQKSGLSFEETETSVSALKQASEVFICNSVRGIWPVSQLIDGDQKVHWPVGPITHALTMQMNSLLWRKA